MYNITLHLGSVVSRDAVTFATKFRAQDQLLEGWALAPHFTRCSDCSWIPHTVSAKTDDARFIVYAFLLFCFPRTAL